MRSVTAPLLVRAEFEGLLHRNRLRFPGPLEREFRKDYYERWVTTNRAALVGGLFVLAGFGIIDLWAAPQSLRTVWLFRFAIGLPVGVLLLLLSFTPLYRRIMQPATAFLVALIGVLITLMELVMRPDEPGYNLYMFGIALVVFFGYAAPRLRFWYAAAAGWTAVVSSWWIGFDHSVWQSEAAVHFVVLEAFLIGSGVIGTFASYFLESGARRTFLQQLLIEQEQERSEALLLNVLPALIADRLKGGEDVVDAFDEVSVLFADIVDFTPFSATLSPHELVTFLNNVFSRFDELAEKHDLEKIKTMGDAYMVVGGVPTTRVDHAGRIAEMALDMQDEASRMTEELTRSIQLRIGLNTGPVVAGVIGRRKFSYDLWGDTVNTASRMQAIATPGKIQVTRAVFERLKDRYVFEGPTAVLVKGKGEMPTYCLTRRRGRAQDRVDQDPEAEVQAISWRVP
ncbi:MAG: adenylate/guanylate cyclase domain-containing protein [Actinomycetota bacterium]